MQEKSNYRTMIGLIIVWGRKKNDERHVNHHQLSNYQTTILMLPLTRRRTIRGAMTTTRRPRSSFHLLRVIIVDSQFKRSSSVQFSYQWEVLTVEMPSNSFSLDPRLVSLLNSFLEMGVDATKHSSPSAILCQQKSSG